MKLYENLEFRRSHEQFIWKKGSMYLMWLTGFNIHVDGEGMFHIDPVYKFLFRFSEDRGYPVIEMPWFAAKFTDYFPFIDIQLPENEMIGEISE